MRVLLGLVMLLALLLAVPALRRVYAAATGAKQVAVIDEDSLRVFARVRS